MQGIQSILKTAGAASLLSATLISSVIGDDLRDVYDQAKLNDAQYRAAGHTLEANREAKPFAKSGLLPSVILNAGTRYGNGDSYTGSDHTASAQLDLTQPLFNREHYMQYKQADSIIAKAEAEYSTEEQGLIIRVAEAYFNVLAAEDNLQFTRAETKAIFNQLDQAKQRYEVGLIAITDVHEAQASYDNARSNQIQANNLLEQTREALRVIVGGSTGELAKLKPSIPLRRPNPSSLDYWSKQALDNNPAVDAAHQAVEIARKEVEVKRSGHYPTLDLVASKSETWDHPSFGNDRSNEEIGLQLTLPIYLGGSVSSNVRKTRHELKAAMENYEGQKRAVTQQVRDAYRGVETAMSQVKALQASKVSAQSALDATVAGYEVGSRTLVDVLNAQRDLYQARSNHAKARYLYVLNGLYLRQAAGSLGEADLDSVNTLLK
ncbi:TolC family outer membrane protein [Solemya elarraichensis gill symbiont]|uniref:Type I secretion protein TolC n=1 Tax=Solemya elarraichensis gill symbiont TaxID=1918949 RepID=A0A1T2LC25_9GAMM|nr:TolC family outer membrane protein [Solemya elarraichensis gill symbiont]OOZ42584.1 hypothetical protein BOW52_02450 [Solemya elarraichensis gill symbiont]